MLWNKVVHGLNYMLPSRLLKDLLTLLISSSMAIIYWLHPVFVEWVRINLGSLDSLNFTIALSLIYSPKLKVYYIVSVKKKSNSINQDL